MAALAVLRVEIPGGWNRCSFSSALLLHRLLHLAALQGNPLHRAWDRIPLCVLLATVDDVDDREARLVAGLPVILRGDADSLGTWLIPVHLLLLSRGLLQGFLGRSSVVGR